MKTIIQAIITTTIVLIAVARFESTPSIPILARIDVRAANTAEKIANNNHRIFHPYEYCIVLETEGLDRRKN